LGKESSLKNDEIKKFTDSIVNQRKLALSNKKIGKSLPLYEDIDITEANGKMIKKACSLEKANQPNIVSLLLSD
jgi:hypothetical protein